MQYLFTDKSLQNLKKFKFEAYLFFEKEVSDVTKEEWFLFLLSISANSTYK